MNLLMWLSLGLSLVVHTVSGNVRVMVVPDSSAPVPTGPVTLTSQDTTLWVPFTEPVTVQTVSGDITVEVHTPQTAALTLTSVSGDVYLQNPPASRLRITLASGNAYFEGTPADTSGGVYRVSTLSGDLRGALPPVSGWFRSISGDLDLEFPHPAPSPVWDTLLTRTGSLWIAVMGQRVVVDTPGVYQEGLYRLVIVEGEPAADEAEETEEHRMPKMALLLAPVAPEGVPLWVNYNRVDGFTLRLPLVRSQRSLSLGSVRLWSQARLAVSAAFGRRIPQETQRWKHRLGYWTGAALGLRMGRLWPEGFLWAEAWLNQTATPQRWTLPPVENLLGSLLVKYDAYEYYLSSGIAAGVGARWSQRFWLRVGYHTETTDSLSVTQNFSVFRSAEPFRGNPPMTPTDLQGIQMAAEAQVPGGLTLAFWGLRGRSTWHLWQALARTRWSHPMGDVRFRVAAGGTAFEPPSPLAVYLGGLGTVPGYDLHADSGTRFVLFNGEARFSGRGPDLLLFADAGQIPGHPWLMDAGLGLALGPLAVRWVVPLEDLRRYRVYLRLRQWF